MEVDSQLVIAHYQRRLAELEMQNAILNAQVETLQKESGAGRPVSSGKGNEHPAPEG